MRRQFKTVKATLSDAADIALRLSDDDYKELEINHSGMYVDVVKMLEKVISEHEHVFVVVNKLTGTRYAIGGYHGNEVWMLTTNYVTTFSLKERYRFIRELRLNIASAVDSQITLSNYIWEGNKMHVKLVTSMGAYMYPRVLSQNGSYYIPFRFTKEGESNV